MTRLSRLTLAMLGSALFLLPLAAFAHEHRVYQVGNKKYNITVGSLDEPVHVDDKTGVEVIVSDLSNPPTGAAAMSDDGPTGTPVTGLGKSLQVEVSAGDQKKTLSLEPEDGKDGSYAAVFYPTVQTTYSYRIFGTLNGVPLDVTYACNPAPTADTPEDTTPQKLSDQVTQTLKGGAFGCPEAKADAEFPEAAAPLADLTSRVQALESNRKSVDTGSIGIVVGVIGVLVGIGAWIKAGKRGM